MKFCTQCGQPLADDARFCAHCGAKIERTEQPAEPESVPEEIVKTVEEPVVKEDAQPETDFAPETPAPAAPQYTAAPQQNAQPQQQSQVYTAPVDYKAEPAAAAPKKKGGLALPILSVVLALVGSLLIGILLGILVMGWQGVIPGFSGEMADGLFVTARAVGSVAAAAGLVLGIIGLIKNIKARKVAGIILSAVGISYAFSVFMIISNLEAIASIFMEMFRFVS